MSRVPITMTTFNRPNALRRTLDSLSKTEGEFFLLIQDDGSDEETIKILRDSVGFLQTLWSDREQDGGDPNRARRRVVEDVLDTPERYGLSKDCPFVITIESDLVFHPSWLKRLLEFHETCSTTVPGQLVLGDVQLATISPYHGLHGGRGEDRRGGWAYRRSTGGVCHLITKDWYEKGKELDGWMAWDKRKEFPWGWDWPPTMGGWDHAMSMQARANHLQFGVLVPSLVNHVPGDEGTTSGSRLVDDRALDFVGEE